jgi:hypothetical protein
MESFVSKMVSQRARLLAAQFVERRIGLPLHAALGIPGGAGVADEI